ncbi:hypothetical protein LguiA_028819 [Lonicera macranthoides]
MVENASTPMQSMEMEAITHYPVPSSSNPPIPSPSIEISQMSSPSLLQIPTTPSLQQLHHPQLDLNNRNNNCFTTNNYSSRIIISWRH